MGNAKLEVGDLVKSTHHVGLGVILEMVPREEELPQWIHRYNYEPMAMVYWWFPNPLKGKGYQDGIDYEYVARLIKT